VEEKIRVILVGEGEAGRQAARRLAPFCSLTWLQWADKGDLDGEGERADYAAIKALDLLSRTEDGDFEVVAETAEGEKKQAAGKIAVFAFAPQRAMPSYWREQQERGLPVLSLLQLEEKLEQKPRAGASFPSLSRWAFVLGRGGIEDAASTRKALQLAQKLVSELQCQAAVFYQQLSIGRDNNERLLDSLKSQGILVVRCRSPLQVIGSGDSPVHLQAEDAALPASCRINMEADFIAVAEDYMPSPRRKAVLKAAERGSLLPPVLLREEIFYCGNGETPLRGVFWIENWPEAAESFSVMLENVCACIRAQGRICDPLNTAANSGMGTKAGPGRELQVDALRCSLCLTCFRVCPHGAVYFKEAAERRQQGMLYNCAAAINREICWGCGICRSECPAEAIQEVVKDFSGPEEMRFFWPDRKKTGLGRGKKIVVFGCRRSGYLAARRLAEQPSAVWREEGKNKPETESALGEKPQLAAAEIVVKPVDCAGSVDRLMVLRELEKGADGVLIWSCHQEACQHLWGNQRAKKRIGSLAPLLKWAGRQENTVAAVALAAQDLRKAEESINRLLADIDIHAAREGDASDHSAKEAAGRN